MHNNNEGLHLAWVDISTGEFKIASDKNPENLFSIISSLDPQEIVVPQGWSPIKFPLLNFLLENRTKT